MKFKKTILTILGIFVVGVGFFALVHNQYTDRVNPLISQTISYAKVDKGTQRYRDVKIIDPATKQTRSYTLKNVGGYDPDGQYIKINHKGQYVKEIRYISKKEFEKK